MYYWHGRLKLFFDLKQLIGSTRPKFDVWPPNRRSKLNLGRPKSEFGLSHETFDVWPRPDSHRILCIVRNFLVTKWISNNTYSACCNRAGGERVVGSFSVFLKNKKNNELLLDKRPLSSSSLVGLIKAERNINCVFTSCSQNSTDWHGHTVAECRNCCKASHV